MLPMPLGCEADRTSGLMGVLSAEVYPAGADQGVVDAFEPEIEHPQIMLGEHAGAE